MSSEETPSKTDSSNNLPECEGLTEGGTRLLTDSVIAQQDSIRLQAESSKAGAELEDLRQRSQELDEVKAKLKRAHKQMEAVGKSKKKENNAEFGFMRNRVDELEKDLDAAETRYNDIQSDLLYSKQREATLSESLFELEERIRSMTLELTAERASKTNMAVANVELAIDLAEAQEMIAHSTCIERSGGTIDVNTKESSSQSGPTPWGMLPERRHSL